jgi:hypothetical protein
VSADSIKSIVTPDTTVMTERFESFSVRGVLCLAPEPDSDDFKEVMRVCASDARFGRIREDGFQEVAVIWLGQNFRDVFGMRLGSASFG